MAITQVCSEGVTYLACFQALLADRWLVREAEKTPAGCPAGAFVCPGPGLSRS